MDSSPARHAPPPEPSNGAFHATRIFRPRRSRLRPRSGGHRLVAVGGLRLRPRRLTRRNSRVARAPDPLGCERYACRRHLDQCDSEYRRLGDRDWPRLRRGGSGLQPLGVSAHIVARPVQRNRCVASASRPWLISGPRRRPCAVAVHRRASRIVTDPLDIGRFPRATTRDASPPAQRRRLSLRRRRRGKAVKRRCLRRTGRPTPRPARVTRRRPRCPRRFRTRGDHRRRRVLAQRPQDPSRLRRHEQGRPHRFPRAQGAGQGRRSAPLQGQARSRAVGEAPVHPQPRLHRRQRVLALAQRGDRRPRRAIGW
jgi:hypothetical protein